MQYSVRQAFEGELLTLLPARVAACGLGVSGGGVNLLHARVVESTF